MSNDLAGRNNQLLAANNNLNSDSCCCSSSSSGSGTCFTEYVCAWIVSFDVGGESIVTYQYFGQDLINSPNVQLQYTWQPSGGEITVYPTKGQNTQCCPGYGTYIFDMDPMSECIASPQQYQYYCETPICCSASVFIGYTDYPPAGFTNCTITAKIILFPEPAIPGPYNPTGYDYGPCGPGGSYGTCTPNQYSGDPWEEEFTSNSGFLTLAPDSDDPLGVCYSCYASANVAPDYQPDGSPITCTTYICQGNKTSLISNVTITPIFGDCYASTGSSTSACANSPPPLPSPPAPSPPLNNGSSSSAGCPSLAACNSCPASTPCCNCAAGDCTPSSYTVQFAGIAIVTTEFPAICTVGDTTTTYAVTAGDLVGQVLLSQTAPCEFAATAGSMTVGVWDGSGDSGDPTSSTTYTIDVELVINDDGTITLTAIAGPYSLFSSTFVSPCGFYGLTLIDNTNSGPCLDSQVNIGVGGNGYLSMCDIGEPPSAPCVPDPCFPASYDTNYNLNIAAGSSYACVTSSSLCSDGETASAALLYGFVWDAQTIELSDSGCEIGYDGCYWCGSIINVTASIAKCINGDCSDADNCSGCFSEVYSTTETLQVYAVVEGNTFYLTLPLSLEGVSGYTCMSGEPDPAFGGCVVATGCFAAGGTDPDGTTFTDGSTISSDDGMKALKAFGSSSSSAIRANFTDNTPMRFNMSSSSSSAGPKKCGGCTRKRP